MTWKLRGKHAIVGVGHSILGKAPGYSPLDLAAQATHNALADCGMDLSEIDGICGGTFYHFFPTLSIAEYLGIRPTWMNSDMFGGSSFMSYVQQATAAIEAGLCKNVLIVYGSNARSSRNLNGLIETPESESPYEAPVPITGYALATQRHMHQYGTTLEQLAEVAVSARKWAQLNPEATMRDPLTMDEVMSSPTIASPLRVRDCCLLSDGGAAVIVTSADRAKDLPKPPVYVLGASGETSHREIAQMPDLTTTGAVQSGKRAFEMAGITHSDVDVVQLYDAFTINMITILEDLGFCAQGEGGAFVSGGRIAPGGDFPVNTNGGGLSCVHPGMYGLFAIIEAVVQVRGAGGDRQVDGVDIAIAHGNGGAFSHQMTNVFGSAAAL